jgi:hypothetical protein
MSKAFFERLVSQKKFTMWPNLRKNKDNHPDLIAISEDLFDDGNKYVISGWVVFNKKNQTNILRVVISKVEDQKAAQDLYNAGTVLPEAKLDPNFKLENEDELPI